ncbi:hypothetical protein VL4N_13820 [Vagococcus lutrae]|uniref:hypothetical protein n=1 Tax=Vagococcus lutrae TaxID=81947 RepID=UPI00192794CE|nr:hypothetical protein [Vagococcus lutrae]GEQ62012.1 hypothetical protein VL2N_13480 [Vagococcus lutrae]GEQ63941.1 hypothetical protein VL3N_13830 [Vagococcus lutrae]GEQ65832.1 hypothetical protein VL4N_13820 [Vagococcus lutrae]
MSYRIQFTITDEEYKELEDYANANGIPNVQELAKQRTLQKKTSIHDLYKEMNNKIKKMDSGETFRLNQIIEGNFPSLLGKWLNDDIDNRDKNIGVERFKQDNYGWTYMKK